MVADIKTALPAFPEAYGRVELEPDRRHLKNAVKGTKRAPDVGVIAEHKEAAAPRYESREAFALDSRESARRVYENHQACAG